MTQSKTITLLTPNRWYKVTVAGKNVNGTGPASDPVDFLTATEPQPSIPGTVTLSYGDEVLGGNDGLNYTCVVKHTSASTNRPGMSPPTADAAKYWALGGVKGVAWANAHNYVTGIIPALGKKYKIKLTLVWVAPTTKADGSPVSLSGYKIDWFSSTDGSTWVKEHHSSLPKSALTASWTDASPNTYYQGKLVAISRGDTQGIEATSNTITNANLTPPVISNQPQNLVLTQNGTSITAKVDPINRTAVPDFSGFRFWVSKQTGQEMNYKAADGRLTRATFHDAWDNSAGAVKPIAIGDTIFVKVTAFNEGGADGPASGEGSIIAGGAVPSAPGTPSVTPTVIKVLGKKYKVKLDVTWTAPTENVDHSTPVDLSGYTVEYQSSADSITWVTEHKINIPKATTLSSSWTDATPALSYRVVVTAISRHHASDGAPNYRSTATSGTVIPTVVNIASGIPTNLTLQSNGTTITAKVDPVPRFGVNGIPDFSGYRFYATKQDPASYTFTPSVANCVCDGRLNKATFHEAYNGSALETIKIGESIWVKATVYNEAGVDGTTIAVPTPAYIVAGGTAPATPTFQTGQGLTLTQKSVKGRVLNVKADVNWTAPSTGITDLSHYRVDIYGYMDKGAGLQWYLEKTVIASKNNPKASWSDNDPDTSYYVDIYAVSRNGQESGNLRGGPVSASAVGQPTNASNPTAVAGQSSFQFRWTKSADLGVKTYEIGVCLANNSAGAGVMKSVDASCGSCEIDIDGAILGYDVTYWWWIRTKNVNDLPSAWLAFNPASLKVNLATWQKHFTRPWKMASMVKRKIVAGQTNDGITQPSGNGATISWTVGYGKVGLLSGYRIRIGRMQVVVDNSSPFILDNQLGNQSGGWSFSKSPQYTNGMFLKDGDKFQIYLGDGTAQSFNVLEFDAEVGVFPIFQKLQNNNTYTVGSYNNGGGPARTLSILWAIDGTPTFDGNGNPIANDGWLWADLVMVHNIGALLDGMWTVGNGVLQFPNGTVLKAADSNGAAGNGIYLFGIETVAA